jgi:hypothetical protein
MMLKHCKVILESRQKAMLFAVAFSVLPFASWLSVALISLITLRKGAKAGFDVLLPALVVHSVPLMMLIPLSNVLINTLIEYLPCYFAALALRKTEKWQIVYGVFFIQAVLGCLLIQSFIPDFIVLEFNQLKLMLIQYQELIDSNTSAMSTFNLAQLFFGIQLLSVLVSAVISLMFARSMQAKLFLPGGFKNELLAFRSGKLSLLALVILSLGAYQEIPLAINMLPVILCYFLVSGFCLAYFILARKSQFKIGVLLFLLILLKPTFVLFAYIVCGVVDSLFNFRSYLPNWRSELI